MTVAEVIEFLQDLPQDAEVKVWHQDGGEEWPTKVYSVVHTPEGVFIS
jgi:hypothetical protein